MRLHRDALGQVAGLIDVAAAGHADVVEQELQREGRQRGSERFRGFRHGEDVFALWAGGRDRSWVVLACPPSGGATTRFLIPTYVGMVRGDDLWGRGLYAIVVAGALV